MVGELIGTKNMSNCLVGVHNQFFECAHLPCNCSLKKTQFCKCADLLCICSILEPSLGPTFYFQGHPGKRRGSWMADRMRQMHNRSAPFNDAIIKKSLVFDYRRSQMCTPPERLQGRIFEMCGPIVQNVIRKNRGLRQRIGVCGKGSGSATRDPVFP